VTAYAEFLEAKRLVARPAGVTVDPTQVHPSLFGFQRDLVVWAARKGRAAVFADTGLGKTRIAVEWARLIGQRTLLLAPLSVARQHVAEARRIGVELVYARHQDQAGPGLVLVANYEMVDHFDPAAFGIAQATDYARAPLLPTPAVDHRADLASVARATGCGDLRRTHILSYQVWKQAVKKHDTAGDEANEAMMRATLERLAALEQEGRCGG